MEKTILNLPDKIKVKASLIGQNIKIKQLDKKHLIANDPVIIQVEEMAGYAAIFRYGVLVSFNLDAIAEKKLLNSLQEWIIEPYANPETESVELYQQVDCHFKIETGVIFVPEVTIKTLQIIAYTLAKSVVLAYYEAKTNKNFDNVEPFAIGLQKTNWNKRQKKELIKQLGNTLRFQHKMVGRVQVIDKPELLWDNSQLEKLHYLLEKEYEIEERHSILERKLELITRTAETALGLLQYNNSMVVEWYIVILIILEIVLSLYQMIFRE
jgi:uncharacterized Rmd1/YagE family protein